MTSNEVNFIPSEKFKIIVENTPLISIDFITKYKDKVLLGKRVNRPAKNYYFTTGGIIRKNETFNNAMKRIVKDELGILLNKERIKFIGVFEHFYDDSIFEGISTHYINHGYILELDEKLVDLPKEQHNDYRWYNINELLESNEVHKYVKDYFN